ncbi:hypothetical protein JCM14076_02210 [Methylosoma difficile]
MARDYKHRVQGKKTPRGGRRQGPGPLRIIAVVLVLAGFGGVLAYLHFSTPKTPVASEETAEKTAPTDVAKTEPEKQAAKPAYPHFDFYHSLPKKEIVIPEHEVKTRSREEAVGKSNDNKQYMVQAGSFSSSKEAEQLGKKLAKMGIPAKIDKVTVKVNNKAEKSNLEPKVWYRVKIGPYNKMTSVDTVKSRLKKSGIDAVVTQIGR